MKLLSLSNSVKWIIIIALGLFFALLATSCGSQSGDNPTVIHDTIVATPIEHMPLWKCTMTFADSTVAESYTYAKDRYDADRTLTSIVSDSVYIAYRLDTVVVVNGTSEDRR